MTDIRSQSGTARPLQLVGLLVALLVSWVLWSGIYKPLLLWLGLFSCLLSMWLAQRMGFFRHPMSLRSILRLPAHWWWLLLLLLQIEAASTERRQLSACTRRH